MNTPDVIIAEKKCDDVLGAATLTIADMAGFVSAGMTTDGEYVPFSINVSGERVCYGIIHKDAYERMRLPRDDGYHKFKQALREWLDPLNDEMLRAISISCEPQNVGGYTVVHIPPQSNPR